MTDKLKAVEHDQEADYAEKRRQQAAFVLQKHFSSHPDSVIVVSMKDGKVQCDISPFPDLASMCFAKNIIERQFMNSFEGSLAANRRAQEQEQESKGGEQ